MMIKNTGHKRPITGIFPVLRFAIDKGIKTTSLFKGTGLRESDLFDSQNDISLDQELTILQTLNQILPAPETAWELGRYYTARAHGTLGSTLSCAPTFGDVISCIIDYSILSHSHFRFYPKTMGEKIRVYLMENHHTKDLLPFLTERDLISGFTDMETSLPGMKSEIISAVFFAHGPRTDIDKYKSRFIENIAFNHPATCFDINTSAMNIPIPEGNHQEFELFKQQCQAKNSLHRENRFFLSDHVRLCLQTHKGRPRIREVAEMLNMSERSLRRRLNQEGTGFREVKNQFIFQQALHLLRNPDLNIEEISESLGYSETSAFTRAFQKWTGKSPGNFRRAELAT